MSMDQQLTRRYLFPVRPRHLETLDSYSNRLLEANFETDMHRTHLTRLQQADHPELSPAQAWSQVITAKTGRDTRRLQADSIPTATHPDGSRCEYCTVGITKRFMCTLCAEGSSIQQHSHLTMNICLRHRRWVGPSTTPENQPTIGDDMVAAELDFRKLHQRDLIDAPLYATLRKALAPVADATQLRLTAADMLVFPLLVALAKVLTGVDFSRQLFNPANTFAEAFHMLSIVVRDIVGAEYKTVSRLLWLALRPTFLTIRESIEHGETYAAASPHDFPLRPSVTVGFASVMRPLEPFSRYLKATGDDTLTTNNYAEVLYHSHRPTPTGEDRKSPSICRAGHRLVDIRFRLENNTGHGTESCPVCEHRTILHGFNDMSTTHPRLALEFHPTRNVPLNAHDIFAGSSKTYWWLCNKGHEFQATASNRSAAHSGCPICLNRVIIPGLNDAATQYPHLRAELHPTKNPGRELNKMSSGSNTPVWWLCPTGHTYRSSIGSRARGAGCHFCARRESNARTITKSRPDLAAQWHPTANLPRTPDDVTIGSQKPFTWLCPTGHSYSQRPDRRNAGNGCPFCSHRKVEPGINDAQTLHPEICSEWHSYLNTLVEPSSILPGTKLYWWKCKANQHTLQQSIPHRVESGGCTQCAPEERVTPRQRA